MSIVKGHCLHDALPHTFHINMFKCGKNNSTTIKHIYKESVNLIDSCFWHNWLVESHVNNAIDWHGEYGDALAFITHDFWQLFGFLSFRHDCLPWPIDYLMRIWSIFVVTLTLNFQVQIWNLLHLTPKWSDCHKTKSKHINWTLGLKCDHQVWPWPWPWPWISKVKYGICYISTKSVQLPWNKKQTYWVWPWPWSWPLNFQGQMWPWPLTTCMALTKYFHGKILK